MLFILTAIALLGCNPSIENEQQMNELIEKIALKEVVDQFSTLADIKDVDSQMLLFTEDAIVESYRNGERSSLLQGQEEIGAAFSNFLGLFHTVYHINGQQTVSINGNKATGTSYCLVKLISKNEEGKDTQITYGVTYYDEFEKKDSRWLISKRKSYFNWEEIR